MFLKGNNNHPTYWKCKECGFVFAHPQKPKDYRVCYTPEMIYPSSELEINVRRANYELRYNEFKGYIHKKSILLDIGTFNGIFLHYMQSIGFNCFGMEPNWKAAEYAVNHFGLKISPTTLEKFVSDMNYDIITMFNVLEHVRDINYTVNRIRELLAFNGIFVFEIPNIFHPAALVTKGRWYHYENGHNWFFDKIMIRKFISERGFVIKKVCFVPKVITLAKFFDAAMMMLRGYRTYKMKRKIQLSKLYCLISRQWLKVDMKDHILVVCQKF